MATIEELLRLRRKKTAGGGLSPQRRWSSFVVDVARLAGRQVFPLQQRKKVQ